MSGGLAQTLSYSVHIAFDSRAIGRAVAWSVRESGYPPGTSAQDAIIEALEGEFMATLQEDLTLDRLIDQNIALGHTDPHEFPDLLRRALGDELVEVAKPYLDDFIAEMARHRMGALRRSSIAKITPSSAQDPKTLLRSLWVPNANGSGIAYKTVGQMTAEDFDARADFLDRMILGIKAHTQWCRDCAEKMRAENVKTARRLSSLPPLPEV